MSWCLLVFFVILNDTRGLGWHTAQYVGTILIQQIIQTSISPEFKYLFQTYSTLITIISLLHFIGVVPIQRQACKEFMLRKSLWVFVC